MQPMYSEKKNVGQTYNESAVYDLERPRPKINGNQSLATLSRFKISPTARRFSCETLFCSTRFKKGFVREGAFNE